MRVITIRQDQTDTDKLKKKKEGIVPDLRALTNDCNMKKRHIVEVRNRFEILDETGSGKGLEGWKESIITLAENVIPDRKKQEHRNRWVTEIIHGF